MADYTLTAKLMADAKDFIKGFGQAQEKLDGLSGKMKDVGSSISGFGAKTAAVGAGVTAGVTLPFIKAVSVAADFDSAMRKAGAIAGANAEELDKMTEAALHLGATTSLSGSEVANAMAEMAAKGFDANQTISAMPGVIAAAEASGEDLALTADVVASALTGFGLAADESTRVADVLAMAANMTAAGVGDMGYAFKYAAPIASNLGISMEELAAAVGIMTNAGLDGSQAGTTLRMALGRLIKPTKEGIGMLNQLGVTATDAQGNFKPLHEIVGDLKSGMEGMTAAQQQAALATIFGVEAASGMAIVLAQGEEGLKNLTTELENSGGASAEAAAQMKAGIGGALENLGGAIESLTISVMSQLTPTLAELAGYASGLIERFNGMSDSGKKIIAFGIAALAALGPLLTIFGLMTIGLGGFVTAVGTIISPVTLVIAGIIALGVALTALWMSSETFRTTMLSVFETVKAYVLQAVGAIVDFVGEKLGVLREFWQQNGAQIVEAAENFASMLKSVFDFLMPAILFVVDFVWSSIKGVITGALNIIMGAVKIFSGLFTGDFSKMWEGVKQLFSGAIQFVWNLMNLSFLGGIKKIMANLATSLLKATRGMWDDIALRFMYGKDAVVGFVNTLRTNAVTGFTNMRTGLVNKADEIWVGIKLAFSNMVTSVSTLVTSAKTTAVNIFTSLKDDAINLITSLKNSVSTTFQNIKTAITSPIETAKDIVLGIIETIKNAFSMMKITIPKPSLPSISVNMKTGPLGIPYPSFSVAQLARGTDYWQGGFARMNEGGRGELVSLPEGTQVIPHDVSMRYAREAGRRSGDYAVSTQNSDTTYNYGGVSFNVDLDQVKDLNKVMDLFRTLNREFKSQ